MIIVEGPDGAGKTTLIGRLRKTYGFEVGERGTDDRDKLYEVTVPDTFRAIRQELKGDCEKPLIWDRLYFSDLVYAPVQDREVAFTRTERRIIESFIIAAHIPVVLCMPPLLTVMANEGKSHQMVGVSANIERIYRQYDSGIIRVPCHRFDYTTVGSYEAVVDYIDEYLRYRRNRAWSLNTGKN